MVRRLIRGGHQCVVYDRSPAAVEALVTEGAVGSISLDDFVSKLSRPRSVWLMVPAATVDGTPTTSTIYDGTMSWLPKGLTTST
jgi:6-phosphogluconate dehydrogenase